MSTQQGTDAAAGAQPQVLMPEAESGGDDTVTVMHAVAASLARHGLHVSGPESGSHYLKISDVPGISCQVAILGSGSAEWEYRLAQTGQAEADSARIAGVVLAVFGAKPLQSMPSQPFAVRYPDLTARSIAGRVLADHGMHACLEVVQKDEFFFEIHSVIEVTDPAQPHRGSVRIAGNDSIMWECQLSSGTDRAGIAPQDFAATIADMLTESTSPTALRPSSESTGTC